MGAGRTTWDTRYEWKAVTLLAVGFGLVGLDRCIILPLFPVIMKDLGLDYRSTRCTAGLFTTACTRSPGRRSSSAAAGRVT